MGKKEFILLLSEKLDITQVRAREIYDVFEQSIIEGVVQHGSVPFLGKFVGVAKEATTGRNPKTGEIVDVPAKTIIRFKPSEATKVAVNK